MSSPESAAGTPTSFLDDDISADRKDIPDNEAVEGDTAVAGGEVRAAASDLPQGAFLIDSVLGAHYDEFRRRARNLLRLERAGHTLRPTDLVHTAYRRLALAPPIRVINESHIRALMMRKMHHVLADHGRRYGKRLLSLAKLQQEGSPHPDPALHSLVFRLLDELAKSGPSGRRQATLVRLVDIERIPQEEAARELGLSPRQARRVLLCARVWLEKELESRRLP